MQIILNVYSSPRVSFGVFIQQSEVIDEYDRPILLGIMKHAEANYESVSHLRITHSAVWTRSPGSTKLGIKWSK